MLRRLRKKALRGYFDWANRIKLELGSQLYVRDLHRGRFDVKIHSVKIFKLFGTTHIFIKLSRPGLFIGRKGETMNGIREEMEKYHGKIKFHLKDFDPFWS